MIYGVIYAQRHIMSDMYNIYGAYFGVHSAFLHPHFCAFTPPYTIKGCYHRQEAFASFPTLHIIQLGNGQPLIKFETPTIISAIAVLGDTPIPYIPAF